jgi:predicted alpha-1,2-mannosidase
MPFSENKSDTYLINPIARIDKTSEKAEAGYYAVTLTEENIKVELTATQRSGFHRYTFSKGKDIKIFLNAGNRNLGITCSPTGKNGLEGIAGDCYFVLEADAPIAKFTVWDGKRLEDKPSEPLPGSGVVCEFDAESNMLHLKVGISFTSIEAARRNFEAECSGKDFDRIRKDAYNDWNKVLERICVEGDDNDDKTIFYTALYHTCFLPVIYSDVTGTYPGLDCETHRAEGYQHYGGYAFWDSFRTKYPLYSLYLPSVYKDIVYSLRDLYEQADHWGPFPDTDHPPHGSDYKAAGKNGCSVPFSCRHEHMLMVMTDAYFKGLFGVDPKSVYPYMRKEAMLQMPECYDTIGYITARPDQTGEYCWDNWCLAQMANVVGNTQDYNYFMKRSQYWRNTWDPDIRFFRARAADGSWLDFPDDPTDNREKYTYEGSKWHWRWNVVHNVPGLMEIFGGREAFVKELEYFFDHDLYTAGNQIDLQAPWLFNDAGVPWLTQKHVRRILTEPIVQLYGTHNKFPEPIFDRVYKNAPDGYLLEMDCDYGCMAAWYVMSAMGLYQICPGNPIYNIAAPIFKKVVLHLDSSIYSGKTFTIITENLSKENIYIQSAKLNGKPCNSAFLKHEDIVAGGKLVFEMGPDPNRTWGINQ